MTPRTRHALRATLVLASGVLGGSCVADPPNFTNLGTESATEGPTGGMQTTAPADSSTGSDESSTGVQTTDVSEESSTGAGSSSEDDDGSGSICGDGVITGVEDCDCGGGPCTPEGLGNLGCADTDNPLVPGPLTGGVLGCNAASCKFNVDLCTWCGDGTINGAENCEPETAIVDTCLTLAKGTAGDLFCGETCQIDTTGCTDCGVEFSFDDCLDPAWFLQLTHGSAATPPSWNCGLVSGTVGPPQNGETVWATNLSGNYLTAESAAIVSPPIDLMNCDDGERVEMRITHWYEFEGGVFSNADGGIVQVSGDGVSWSTVTPVSGGLYFDEDLLTTAYNPPDGQFGFSGNSDDEGTWVTSAFDVSNYAGETNLQVRLVFGSDNGTNRAGWYIDSVNFVGDGT